MKRILSALLIGTLVLASVTACGKEADSKESKAPKSSTEQPKAQTPAAVSTAANESAATESASGASIAEQFISEPIVDRQIIDRTNTDVIALLNTYKSIMKNESTFFDTDSNESQYINQLPSSDSGNEVTMKVKEFTVIDLDGNGLPEVVLGISAATNDYVIYYLILSSQKNQIYGYSLTSRGFNQLKIDGSFSWAGSASNHGYGKITFKTTIAKISDLIENYTYCDADNNIYVVNNQPATEAEFKLEQNHESHKPDVTWYEYSEENIENYLS